MITRTKEAWKAEANFPECKMIWIEDTKENLDESLKDDLRKYTKVYFETSDKELTDYCFTCLKEIMKIRAELKRFPSD